MAIIDLPELARGLAGAWRLLKLDITGMFHFNSSAEGARRSFQAAIFALPVHVILILLALANVEDGAAGGQVMLIESLLYIIDWTIVPVIVSLLIVPMGWQKRFTAFICAYNYSYLLAHWLWLMAVILASLLGGELRPVLLSAFYIAVIVYQGLVARQALALELFQTVLFCIAIFLINYLLETLRTALVLRDLLPG